MVEILRTTYLEKLMRYVEPPATVAVVGLRRVGKSVLLRQRVVASLQNRSDTRVVLSGSNSTLLAGELATHLAERLNGRVYIQICYLLDS